MIGYSRGYSDGFRKGVDTNFTSDLIKNLKKSVEKEVLEKTVFRSDSKKIENLIKFLKKMEIDEVDPDDKKIISQAIPLIEWVEEKHGSQL